MLETTPIQGPQKVVLQSAIKYIADCNIVQQKSIRENSVKTIDAFVRQRLACSRVKTPSIRRYEAK
jgi:hypothetical protein